MPRWRFACCLAVFIAAPALCTAIAGEAFPFGSELMLDTAPLRGSKRIPMIQIEETGTESEFGIDTIVTGRAESREVIDLFRRALDGEALPRRIDAHRQIAPAQPSQQAAALRAGKGCAGF